MRSTLLTLLLMSLSYLAIGQVTITGTITDEATGEPLIGASVLKKGTSEGTITDIDGSFSLNSADASGTFPVSLCAEEGDPTRDTDVSRSLSRREHPVTRPMPFRDRNVQQYAVHSTACTAGR